jgi:hypothetical protein
MIFTDHFNFKISLHFANSVYLGLFILCDSQNKHNYLPKQKQAVYIL